MFSEDRRELQVIRGSGSQAPGPGGSRGVHGGGPEEDEILKMCPERLQEEGALQQHWCGFDSPKSGDAKEF